MNRYYITCALGAFLLLNPIYSQETAPAEEPAAAETQPAEGFDTISEPDTAEPAPAEPASADPVADQPAPEPEPAPVNETAALPAKTWTDKNGTLYANDKIQFSLASSDELSDVDYVEYKINDGPYIKYAGTFAIPNEGPQTIVYRAVDKAGNKEVDKVFNVVIDNKQPQIRIYPAQSFVIKDGKSYTQPGNFFTFRVTDDFSGIKSVEYSVNSNQLGPYNGEEIQLQQTGTQFIRYRSEDNLGNSTGDNTIVIEVDADRPTVEILPSATLVKVGDKFFARRNTGFTIRGSDTGSGISQILIRIDGSQEWQSYTDTLYFDTEKEHSIEALTVDAVGNESDIKKITFIVDENPPVTTLETSSN